VLSLLLYGKHELLLLYKGLFVFGVVLWGWFYRNFYIGVYGEIVSDLNGVLLYSTAFLSV
jgi:hypothetical protein